MTRPQQQPDFNNDTNARTSRYLGVSWNKRQKKWVVRRQRGRVCHGGSFNDELKAAYASDRLAWKLGLRYNFPHIASKWGPFKPDKVKSEADLDKDDILDELNFRRSKYPGVSWDWRQEKWKAEVVENGETKFCKYFETEKNAARAVIDHSTAADSSQSHPLKPTLERFSRSRSHEKQSPPPFTPGGTSAPEERRDPFTFPGLEAQSKQLPPTFEFPPIPGELTSVKEEKTKTSQYVGVSWHRCRNKWQARRSVNGKAYFNGLYDSEIKAAQASDVLGRMFDLRLNFPNDRDLERLEKSKKSRYVGVWWDRNVGKWRAQREGNGKKHYGGHFDSELEAAYASDRLASKFGHPLNFPGE